LEVILDIPLKKKDIPVRECITEVHREQEWKAELMNNTVNFKCQSQIEIKTKDKAEISILEIKAGEEEAGNKSSAKVDGGELIQKV